MADATVVTTSAPRNRGSRGAARARRRAVWLAPPRRALIALAIGCGTPLLCGLLIEHDLHRMNLVMLPMLVALVISALLGGLVVGAVSAIVSGLALTYWFFPPHDSFHVPKGQDLASLIVFFVFAIFLLAVIGTLLRLAVRETARRVRSETELSVEQRVVTQLQTAILPARIPAVRGVAISATYATAAQRDRVGGDWYSVSPLPDGRVAVSVGDVAGHGIGATAVMAELRHALRAFASVDPSPGRVLELLNRFAFISTREVLASAVYGVVDPVNGTLRYSSAGHCPPMLCCDRSLTHLDAAKGTLLGVDPGMVFTEAHTTLAPGALLVMYSDGLIERRREVLDLGMQRLEAAVRAHSDDHVDDIGRELIVELREDDAEDDAVVLALRLDDSEPEPPETRVRADAAA